MCEIKLKFGSAALIQISFQAVHFESDILDLT